MTPPPTDACPLCRGTKRAFGKLCPLCGGSGNSRAVGAKDPVDKARLAERDRCLSYAYLLRVAIDELILGIRSGKHSG
jgi:hypothetical protein